MAKSKAANSKHHVLYANEAGTGRGHIHALAKFADILGPKFPSVAGLGNLRFATELSARGIEIRQAPPLGFSKEQIDNPKLMGNASWADYLFAIGLDQRDIVANSLMWWVNTIYAHNISILVTEYAPMALLAARYVRMANWQIATIQIGTGYGAPPPLRQHFPQLMPNHSRKIIGEDSGLRQLNAAIAELGMPPLDYLADMYDVDLNLPMTLPFLDPYDGQRRNGGVISTQLGMLPDLFPLGDELFVYFPESCTDDSAICDALAGLNIPCRAYMPKLSQDLTDKLAKSGVEIVDDFVPLQDLIRRSCLFLHSAPHGTVCLGALAGIPQIGLPQHLEHGFMGQRAEDVGILTVIEAENRNPSYIFQTIMEKYKSALLESTCRVFAKSLRAEMQTHPARNINSEIAKLIAAL